MVECPWHLQHQRGVFDYPDSEISLTFQADTGRISNKLRRGSRLVESRSLVKPSVIGHVRVSYGFLLSTAINVRNEVAFWFRRPWAVHKDPRAEHRVQCIPAVRQARP